MVASDENVELDVTYVFSTTESYDEAHLNLYEKWHADFIVSFDRDITATDGVGIAGNYGEWYWIGFKANDKPLAQCDADTKTFKKGDELCLLVSYGLYMNYEELCNWGKEFKYGACPGGNGYLKTSEAKRYFDELNMSREDKANLFAIMCPTVKNNPYK